MASSDYIIGVDIGGTCTDCVVLDADGGVTLGKAFSTPPDFSTGIMDALGIAAEALDRDTRSLLEATRLFLHSTTVAENAIVDGELVPVGLLTTRGYQDTLFATRGGFGRWSGLTEDQKRNPTETEKPPALVPRDRVAPVRERTDASGECTVPVDRDEVARLVRALQVNGAEAFGVCFLWSFHNPSNELAAREVIEEVAPDAFVSLSHEIAPVVGEYERTSTVALNAGLGPVVGRYLRRLHAKLGEAGFSGGLLVMQAYGGLLSLDRAVDRPVGMIESGPVSGLMGCKRQGELLGDGNIINGDMGGTTFKVGVVRDGLIEYQKESLAFRYHYSLPKIDVESLGLAGGSIVAIDPRTRTPRIGPRSAGSYPGPIVYDHGGTEPTVTDVDAVLGFLSSRYFLGGRVELNRDAARKAIGTEIAEPLRLEPEEAAAALYRLANSYIYDLLHRMTVQRGLDPRSFALFSTGGTAGMHLPAVGAALGVRQVVIPYTASVQGAFGLVTSDVVHEELITRPLREPADPSAVAEIFAELEAKVIDALATEGFEASQIQVARSVDVRFARQVHQVTTPLPEGPISTELLAQTIDTFQQLYEQKYGKESTYREAGVEYVTYRVRASGPVPKADPKQWSTTEGVAEDAIVDETDVFQPWSNTPARLPAYDAERLHPGATVHGPALVWSPITTVVLDDRQVASVDEYRNLSITTRREEASR